MGLLAHVPSTTGALAQLSALVKPGGLVVAQITDTDSLIGRIGFGYASWREKRKPVYGYQLQRLSTSSVSALARSVGLSLQRRIRYSLTLPGMDRLPGRFLVQLTSASRSWPLRRVAGESILIFRKQEHS